MKAHLVRDVGRVLLWVAVFLVPVLLDPVFAQNNPLQQPMENLRRMFCAVLTALSGPFGGALAAVVLGLGFAGLIIGNRNAMGLIITAIAGGGLLLAARGIALGVIGQSC